MDFLRILGRTARFKTNILSKDALQLPVPAKPEAVADASRPKRKRKKCKQPIAAPEGSVFAPIGAEDDDDDADDVPAPNATATKLVHQTESRINTIRSRARIRVKGNDVPAPVESWDDLGLPAFLEKTVAGRWQTPTPIQMQAIPILTAGRELLACSPTGSGKTGAFLIPILTQLAGPQPGGFRAVVVAPTVELAQQTFRRLARMSSGSGLGIFLLAKDNRQAVCQAAGRRDVLVSTPKRLADAIRDEALNVSKIEFLIFDEGDCLWDDNGFIDEVDEIIAACTHPQIVRALFSATMPEAIEALARTVLRDPVRIVIGNSDNGANESIRQKLVFAGTEAGKLIALRNLFIEGVRTPILIFVQSKARVRQLHAKLRDEFPKVDYVESEQTLEREDVIKRFRAGTIFALITTEVLARGIDFLGVNCVINYDFPQTVASYIHRVGRTGRAGRIGEAITLFTNDDAVMLRSIAGVLKRSGCDDVPEWMLSRRKPNRSRVKELKTRPPKRKKVGEQ